MVPALTSLRVPCYEIGERAGELLEFLADSPLVAHNAGFDFGFVDAELARLGMPPLDRSRMIDESPMWLGV